MFKKIGLRTSFMVAILLGGSWWLTIKMSVDFERGIGLDWQHASLAALFIMWAVMMAAMMLPSALPFLRLLGQCASLHYQQKNSPATKNSTTDLTASSKTHSLLTSPASPSVSVTMAAAAYLLMWLIFSLAVAGLQIEIKPYFDASSLTFSQPLAQAAVLATAGLYQLSPLKFSCLRGCRPPPLFLLLHWRRGAGGAFLMGAQHGAFCLGCCWALMLLLFVGGVMNLWWIIGLTIYVLIEKTVSPTKLIHLARLSGTMLLLWSAFVLAKI